MSHHERETREHRLVAEMRREEEKRRAGYRERALKLFPHVCGRCGREFEGKKLRELTVHHIDHDHDRNPPDGSNWELLCIYCHDHEHSRGLQERAEEERPAPATGPTLGHSPFADLGQRLKKG